MEKNKGFKRGWTHTKGRGKETVVTCSFCGKKVPKYKTFVVFKGLRISDPLLRKEIGRRGRLPGVKMYACPSCARHRNIVRKRRR